MASGAEQADGVRIVNANLVTAQPNNGYEVGGDFRGTHVWAMWAVNGRSVRLPVSDLSLGRAPDGRPAVLGTDALDRRFAFYVDPDDIASAYRDFLTDGWSQYPRLHGDGFCITVVTMGFDTQSHWDLSVPYRWLSEHTDLDLDPADIDQEYSQPTIVS